MSAAGRPVASVVYKLCKDRTKTFPEEVRDVRVASSAWTGPRTVREALEAARADAADREALVGRSGRLTYRQLDEQADRAAGALAGLGVRPGDRVGACLPNDVDVVVAFHGVMRLGAVWVGVNEALAAPEKAFLLRDARASVLLGEPGVVAELAGEDLPTLREAVPVAAGDSPWRRLLEEASAPPDVDVDPLAPAGIAYTSGTTGRPKGVVHSQHNMLLPGAVLVATRGYGPHTRKGDCLPLTILNMMVLTTLLTTQARGTCVVMDRRDAAGIAEWLKGERVSTWNGVPAMLHSLAHDDDLPATALSSLDEIWSGGGDSPEPLRRAFEAKFDRQLHGTYGLTEAPTVVAIEPRGGRHVPGSSGVALPHLDVTVRDESGVALPVSESGEVCVAATTGGPWGDTYHPMLGYWRRDDTDGTLVDGVLHTGDVGVLDADGNLRIVDRRKLVIVRGGANVYPAEVERVLAGHGDVEGCAVFGVPDERLGQRVAAAVQPKPGRSVAVDELLALCRAQLARYKVPERLVVVPDLPRNAMGKVQREHLPGLVRSAEGAEFTKS
jgi:long-chain acyl-CoA synthetase